MNTLVPPKTVGVMGSAKLEHDDHSRPVGQLLANLGVNLITGGGGGVMNAVSRAFRESLDRRGICIGVLPCVSESDRSHSREHYPNEFVELAIRTHLPFRGTQGTHDLSRNHINVLSSDIIVALPGGEGTASELSLALLYGVPAIAFALQPELVRRFPESIPRVSTIGDLESFLRHKLPQST